MKIRIKEDFSRWSEKTVVGFRQAMLRAVLFLESKVVDHTPYVTGNMRNTVNGYIEGSGTALRGVVAITSKYAKYVVEGTGIYGPHKKPIKPKGKRALAFSVGGDAVVVRSVRGSKPNPFPYEALADSRAGIFKELEEFFDIE